MEEVREVALAYYYNLSEEQKKVASAVFRKIDSNGDGTITFNEYEQFFGSSPYQKCIFLEIDKNGDGRSDFEEFITLYYIHISGRTVFCDGHGCGVLLKAVYFTCFNFFHYNKTTTFDLCCSCYSGRSYTHIHAKFVDNYALLRSKAAVSTMTQNQDVIVKLARIVKVGVDVGQVALANGCSIM